MQFNFLSIAGLKKKKKKRYSLRPELQWLKDNTWKKTDYADAMQVEMAGSDLAQLPGRPSQDFVSLDPK